MEVLSYKQKYENYKTQMPQKSPGVAQQGEMSK